MNILLDRLPTEITICGKPVPIRTGFRYGILLEQISSDKSLSSNERAAAMLNLMFYDIRSIPFDDPQQVYDGLLWFYQGGDRQMNAYQLKKKRRSEMKPEHSEDGSSGSDSYEEKQYYDYDYDADMIYAAFMQQYHVDLANAMDLHWWEFKAMFNGLTDDTKFMKVVGYRSTKITASMSDREKRFYKKMKEIYALPIPKDEIEKVEAMEAALKKGDAAAIMELIGRGGANG